MRLTRSRNMGFRLCSLILLCLSITAAKASELGIDYHYSWVAYGPSGLLARAIVDSNSQCPTVAIDSNIVPMSNRTKNMPAGFKTIKVCEKLSISTDTKTITIGNKSPIKIPDKDTVTTNIAVVGDTGCRNRQQNCDTTQWGFPQIAAAMVQQKSEAIIHLGDYHYREHGDTGCAVGSPVRDGDCWLSWQLDFFHHAEEQSLLGAAPWIFIRGNHETCDGPDRVRARAWRGWFLLLDPAPLKESNNMWDNDQCQQFPAPYKAAIAGRDIWVMDTSVIPSLGDRSGNSRVPKYRAQFDHINQQVGNRPVWLAMHHPIWGMSTFGSLTVSLNQAWSQAKKDSLKKKSEMVFGGHIHLFEHLRFTDKPDQFIFGGGGTNKDREPSKKPNPSFNATNMSTSNAFDFGTLTPSTDHWKVQVHSVKNAGMTCKKIVVSGSNNCSYSVPYL